MKLHKRKRRIKYMGMHDDFNDQSHERRENKAYVQEIEKAPKNMKYTPVKNTSSFKPTSSTAGIPNAS